MMLQGEMTIAERSKPHEDRIVASYDVIGAKILTLQQGDDMVALDWDQIYSLYLLMESLLRDARIK